MRFVDGEEGQRDALQPLQRVVAHQPFRRQIQQPQCALLSAFHEFRAVRRVTSELFRNAAAIPAVCNCAA